MAFPTTALDSPALTKLRGSSSVAPRYSASQYLCLCPNTVVFSARVNGTPSGTSFAQVAFDTVTVGAYTDLEVGETVMISSTSDYRATPVFIGRVRKTPTSSILYINETSALILDNYYITVLHDFRIWDKLAAVSSGVQFKDYDLTFSQLKPVIFGLQSAYAGICSSSPERFSTDLTAQAYAGTNGASISSYAWTVPGGGTVTGGATNTAHIVIAWTAGFYWLKLVVTDSASRTQTFHIPVWAVPSDFSSVVSTGFDGASITGDENGWSASMSGFDGISTVLDNTLCCLFDVEYYNETESVLNTAVKFVGRLRTETSHTQADDTASQLQDTRYEIEGILAQMGRIEHLPFTLITKTSPTVWDQIANLTIWRGIVYALQEHSTVLNLCSLQFDTTGNTFLYPALPTQGGNILAIVEDLASSMNGVVENAPTGELQIGQNLNYLSSGSRALLPTLADWTAEDTLDWQLQVEHVRTTGKVDGSGGTYSSSSGLVTPVLSVAPGMAQDYGENLGQLTKQILNSNINKAAAQSEINIRTGMHLAVLNPTPQLTVQHPGGYNFLIPTRRARYTWTIASTDNTMGRAYSTADYWNLTSITIDHDNGAGDKSVEAIYKLETSGAAGDTVEPPVATEIADPLPPIPPLLPYPAFPPLPDVFIPPEPSIPPPPTAPIVLPKDGNTVLLGDQNRLFLTMQYAKAAAPHWIDITPPLDNDEIIQHAIWGFYKDIYCLVTDNTDSRVFYCIDITVANPVWTAGASVSGIYGLIRGTQLPGAIYLIPAVGAPAPDSCGDNFSVNNVEGNTALGTFLGVFGGKYRYQSEIFSGDGNSYLTIMTSDKNTCCTFVSLTIVSGSIGVGDRNIIYCGDDQLIANFSNDDPTGQSINYLAYQSNTAFVIDIEWATP